MTYRVPLLVIWTEEQGQNRETRPQETVRDVSKLTDLARPRQYDKFAAKLAAQNEPGSITVVNDPPMPATTL